MDIAFLPFAAAVLADAFRDGHGQRTAVVFHGLVFEAAAILFNIIWCTRAATADCSSQRSTPPV
jgi:hypothetical protein